MDYTRIYQVTIDALNEFSYNEYKKEEKVYDAAESMLKGFKGGKDYKESIKAGLEIVVLQVTDDICKDFLETLYNEICKDENDILYKEITLIQQEQVSEKMDEGFKDNSRNHEKTHSKLNYAIESIDYIKANINSREGEKVESSSEIPIENRAEEYASKWDKNVFLNDFNERDEKAGINIKLRELYLEEHLPHYIWKSNTNLSCDLKELLKEYIVDNNDKKMLLVLGQPGIGKSTLITWIMANLVERKDKIYVYQFASDLKSISWQDNNILNEIAKTINMKLNEWENKILVFDGFDEIYINSDREEMLNQIYYQLKEINYLKRFSLIITCRENYIDKLNKIKCDYIVLQPWDIGQIQSFCRTYGNAIKSNISRGTINRILKNKEIFGIALILYMVLALNISIEENGSIVDVYDRIFSLDGGGIYDRCIRNLSYAPPHRISTIKQQIHKVSQKIAFWIYENNAEDAFISQKEYKEICNVVISNAEERSKDIQSDVLIGSYFKLIKHCEGIDTDEICFVHRSIYEYFVAVYFYESIHKSTSKEEVAGKLGILLKKGDLTKQILEFIQYKFDNAKICCLPDIIKEIFQIMLKDGMTYHMGLSCKNAMNREMKIFLEMLEIVGLWNSNLGKVDDGIIIYLQCNRMHNLNLKGMKLREADLRRANLREADLREADLRGADLREADLSRANLSGANLSEVKLNGANLKGANLNETYLKGAYLGGMDLEGVQLRRADLRGAYLGRANLKGVDLGEAIFDSSQIDLFNLLPEDYDLSNSMIYIIETGEIVGYREYCIRNQQM